MFTLPVAAAKAVKAVPNAVGESAGFNCMWYKSGNGSIGIRQRSGDKRQIMAISCKGLSREELQTVASKAVQKLVSNEDLGDVKTWAANACQLVLKKQPRKPHS